MKGFRGRPATFLLTPNEDDFRDLFRGNAFYLVMVSL